MMINRNVLGAGMAVAVPTAGTSPATRHAATPMAAGKHRVAAATEASVGLGVYRIAT